MSCVIDRLSARSVEGTHPEVEPALIDNAAQEVSRYDPLVEGPVPEPGAEATAFDGGRIPGRSMGQVIRLGRS